MQSPDLMIEVSALCQRVTSPEGPLTLLNDINFSIYRGEVVAVTGPSGSGKSTLLGLLAGLDTPSGGQVKLAGIDLFALDEDGRAALRGEQIGFVFQSFQLLAALTALENVMLPLELQRHPAPRLRAEQILQRVGLSSRLKHYPRQLSGGEQQRVAIARAFVTQPAILFADEPTGNLDQQTGQGIIDLLLELNSEQGATLVLVTHDERLAEQCGRHLSLDGGCLVAAP